MTMTAERRRVCASNPKVPHGVGHNAVCVCNCRWCREERADVVTSLEAWFTTRPVQTDLFASEAA
jgi:hypothetical protein